ncbi:MAG: Fe-Mn family superoxide dismutase, partial [Rhodospirillales bacterium]|nr:Fe-Mn family superoxide dismutase [Acetobacter sp.]
QSATKKPHVIQAEKHQNQTLQSITPILVLDVWERAYYLKYQNKRADYVKAFMTIVNYDDVAARHLRLHAFIEAEPGDGSRDSGGTRASTCSTTLST